MNAFTRPDPTAAQMLVHLRQAADIARAAMEQGHHPFGALLVAPDHETVLLIQGNVDSVNHAEAVIARQAAAKFDADLLWDCTLYTTVEPCCMCSGTQYWAGIGRLVYGMSESRLRSMNGSSVSFVRTKRLRSGRLTPSCRIGSRSSRFCRSGGRRSSNP